MSYPALETETGCLQAESVLAWLATHRVLESSLHAHCVTDRRFRLLVYDRFPNVSQLCIKFHSEFHLLKYNFLQ